MEALVLTENKIYKNSIEEKSSYKKLKLNKEQKDVLDNILNSENNKFFNHCKSGMNNCNIISKTP